MGLHQPLGAVDAGRNDARARVFLGALAERAALAAVEGEHGRINSHAGKGLVDHVTRDAGSLRLAPNGGKECLEIAAALGGEGLGCKCECNERADWPEISDHETDLFCPPLDPYTVVAGLVPPRPCRHARLYVGHPRLRCRASRKTWMAGTSPTTTCRAFKRH